MFRFVLLGIALILLQTAHAQSWFQLSDFPGLERDDGASFTIGTKAYCGSGVIPFRLLGDFYSFDVLSEQWDTISALPLGEERQYACGFASDSLGYIFGGYDGVFRNDLWQYQPANDLWLQKSPLPAVGRGGAASFVIDSMVYIVGGKTDSLAAIVEVWAYNMINDSWVQKQDFPFDPRWRSAACSNGQKGYLAFGLDDSLKYHSEVYAYDPTLDQWTLITVLPEGGRNYVKMHIFGSKLITIGGNDSVGNFLDECWEYDLNTSVWTSIAAFPNQGRRGGMSFESANAIYYTTGLTSGGIRFKESWKLEDPTELQELELEQEGRVRVFPNPAADEIWIEIHDFILNDSWKLRVLDVNGTVLFRSRLHQKKNRIILRGMPSALYIIELKNERYSERLKFLKYDN